MEADKVKFLDGLEVQAELDAIQKEDKQKLIEERQKLIEEQRILVAQRIATGAAEAKSKHLETCVIEISFSPDLHDKPLAYEVTDELKAANWHVHCSYGDSPTNSVYKIRPMRPSDKNPSNS